MWIQSLTLLEDQGLWIQTTALHCSYAKGASDLHGVYTIYVDIPSYP